jgi:uridine kinase
VIHHDSYYHDLSHLPMEDRVRTNFDHPDSLDTALLVAHLELLLAGASVDVPQYDFSTHTRHREPRRVAPRPLVILDGILVLADPELRRLMDYRVYVDTDPAARLERRVRRDVRDRGRTRTSVIEQFRRSVEPMHERFVEPSRAYADSTITEGGHNRLAVDELARTLVDLLRSRIAPPALSDRREPDSPEHRGRSWS